MFEPVHGSAPDIAGKGLASPVAAVLSLSMCLNHLGESEAALAIENAAVSVLAESGTMGTTEIGDLIAARIDA